MDAVAPADLAEPFVVSAAEVGRKLGIYTPLTDEQRERIEDVILDVQADVEASLNGRSLRPITATLTSVYPDTAYALTDYRAWPYEQYDDDVLVVGDPVANADGTYNVTLSIGLDGRAERPIRRFIIASAAEALRNDPASGLGKRVVTSMSAEGQSISYAAAATVDGAAGAVPTIATLRRYKRVAIFRRDRPPVQPWPYGDTPYWRRP